MPAPKGSKNGQKAWFKSIEDKPSVKKYVRLSQSQADIIDSILASNETFSDFARLAIQTEIEKRLSQ